MKYRDEVEGEGGWTDWVFPTDFYKIACCHCGLVHEFEFRVSPVEGEVEADRVHFMVTFRARRDNRATGQKRRWMSNRVEADRLRPR